jgi:pyruvate,orthophosphate dikinase
MDAAEGILTARGGMTSHAAVVCRGMGKPCVCGFEQMEVHEEEHYFVLKGRKFSKGEIVTINGQSGEIFEGEVPLRAPEIRSKHFQ